jgi:cell division protein FtsZ
LSSIGIANLSKYVDTIIIIPNDKLLEALPVDTPMVEALAYADDNLRQGVCGIADLISTPALINLDFADVRTILLNQGLAHMGIGRAKGEDRVVEAVRKAVSSPLLETTIEGARGVIINITGGRDVTLSQIYEAANIVQSVVDYSANIIFGANIRDDLQEEIEITIIATGFAKKDGLGAVEDSRFKRREETRIEDKRVDEAPVKKREEEKRVTRVVTSMEDIKHYEEDDKVLKKTADEDDSRGSKGDVPPFMRKLLNKNKK